MTASDSTFFERYGPWALVVGASEGVGAAYPRAMAERGLNVVLISRRQAVLDDLRGDDSRRLRGRDTDHRRGLDDRRRRSDRSRRDVCARGRNADVLRRCRLDLRAISREPCRRAARARASQLHRADPVVSPLCGPDGRARNGRGRPRVVGCGLRRWPEHGGLRSLQGLRHGDGRSALGRDPPQGRRRPRTRARRHRHPRAPSAPCPGAESSKARTARSRSQVSRHPTKSSPKRSPTSPTDRPGSSARKAANTPNSSGA